MTDGCDPLKGRAREDCSLAGALSLQYAPVHGAGLALEFGEVGQAGVAADVAGAVDDGLDPHRPPVLEVLLDPGVLVEDVQDHAAGVGADGRAVDGGAEGAGGIALDAPPEDDLDAGGPADVEVVRDESLEEEPGAAGGVEHDGPGCPGLPHRALPPVAGVAVGGPERHGDAVHPALGEDLDGAGLQPVADLLQVRRVVTGGEPVGQRGEPDHGLDRLPLGPLVAIDPDLGRVGEGGADLDERRAEVLIPSVEVVAGHPAVGLRERVLRGRRLRVAPVSGP
ncbi:MAG: hypothetical protein ACRDN1_02385, partial [Trebonia sp.]